MPKSKRDRAVSLTKTKRKGLELKQNLISEIRECLDSYENVFIISVFNQRNNYLKELRQDWSHSKFIFGKNKVIALAFGRGPESEYKDQLHKLCPHLTGNVGILLTNSSKDEVVKYFETYACPDFARSGNIATDDVMVEAGPLKQFQHTMEPQLRQLGMHTSLLKGIVTLDTDFQICKKGDKLTPEQARLLKLFDIMQAEFKINVKAYWNKSGEFELLQNDEDSNKDENNNNENNNDSDNNDDEEDVDDEDDEEMEELPSTKRKKK